MSVYKPLHVPADVPGRPLKAIILPATPAQQPKTNFQIVQDAIRDAKARRGTCPGTIWRTAVGEHRWDPKFTGYWACLKCSATIDYAEIQMCTGLTWGDYVRAKYDEKARLKEMGSWPAAPARPTITHSRFWSLLDRWRAWRRER